LFVLLIYVQSSTKISEGQLVFMRDGTKMKRGRPKKYDSDVALGKALETFWKKGYTGTSLDELSEATEMNRPSLYAAFGGKRDIYVSTIEMYRAMAAKQLEQALAKEIPIKKALLNVYTGALEIYYPSQQTPRGCYMIGTATVEAVHDKKIKAAYLEGLKEIERALHERFAYSKQKGEIAQTKDIDAMASMAVSVLYSLAVRSRAGDTRETLEKVVGHALTMICD
jgi:AcrR family transcriptional regulator